MKFILIRNRTSKRGTRTPNLVPSYVIILQNSRWVHSSKMAYSLAPLTSEWKQSTMASQLHLLKMEWPSFSKENGNIFKLWRTYFVQPISNLRMNCLQYALFNSVYLACYSSRKSKYWRSSINIKNLIQSNLTC